MDIIIPILSIIAMALVSIIAIKKTAEANRISIIHNEMLHCIIDSIKSISKIMVLLSNISKKVVYYKVPQDTFIDTAYDRYWSKIKDISEEFNINQSKRKFVLPKDLYTKIQNLIDKINEAKRKVKYLKPDENHVYPNTEDLETIVKEINSIYIDFVHEARVYVGVDALKPFAIEKEQILGVEEAKEKK